MDIGAAASGRGPCLKASLGGRGDLGLNAEAWLGSLKASASWPLLGQTWNYVPSTSHPSGCNQSGESA